MLAEITGAGRMVTGTGDTVRAVLHDALEELPTLRVHLFDESGELRPHVQCFLNETNTRWLESLEEPVADGDELTVLQAVSGG